MIPVPDISQRYPKTSLTLDSRFVAGEGNARDLSGDANTGTLVSGRAVLFDGAADYIDCGAGIDLSSTGGSMSVWVKPSAIDGSSQIIFETDNGGNRFSLQMFNAVFQVSWFPTATYRGVASSSVSADKQHCFIRQRCGSICVVYHYGQLWGRCYGYWRVNL